MEIYFLLSTWIRRKRYSISLDKPKFYGLGEKIINLINHHLSNRKQNKQYINRMCR